jgi:hypothetical protein
MDNPDCLGLVDYRSLPEVTMSDHKPVTAVFQVYTKQQASQDTANLMHQRNYYKKLRHNTLRNDQVIAQQRSFRQGWAGEAHPATDFDPPSNVP